MLASASSNSSKGNVPGSQPEQRNGVELVGIGDHQDWEHKEKQDVSQDEIGSEEPKFGDLAEEFTARLGECVPSHGVPFTGPPGNVGSVGLELTSERKCDDELEEETLDGHHSDHTGKRPRETETFQEHHDHKEYQEHDDSDGVGDGSKDSTKLLTAHAEERTRATSQGEETSENTGVDSDRAESDDRNTDQSTRGLGIAGADIIRVKLGLTIPNTGLRVDEQEWNDGDGNQDQGTKDLSHEDVGEGCARNISR